MSRRRLILAGLATTLLVACRLMDIVFAIAIVAWLVWKDRRALRWFLPAPILGGLGLLAFNFWFFGSIVAIGLEGALARPRALASISAITVVFSIAVQIVGAFCSPSTWNSRPLNVDLNHNRLWDWRDSELSRCLIESFRPPGR
jgi:hypothetical protein